MDSMTVTNQPIAGIDVHKKVLVVVVRLIQEGKVIYEKRKFGGTKEEIQHLAAWLQHWKATVVVMESTAQYWRPLWYGLEVYTEPRFELHLCNPLKIKAPRGKKRDYRDAQRLADRWAAGDLEDSFVPGQEQREWRSMTRARVHMKRKIGINRCQVEGLLEHGTIKLSSVVSDLFGATGWGILKLIAAGVTDVDVLVKQARGSLRRKDAELREALAGKLEPTHRLLLKQHMEQVELLRKQVEELNQALAVAMKEYVPTLTRLCKIPGVDLYSAQELLSEIGPKASAFPSAEQFAGWVGICPGSKESAGVNYSSRSPKGNRYLRRLLCQIAWGAVHNKESFFAGLFGRLKPRIEGRGAAWAVAHRIGKVIWLILHEEVEYKEMGPGKVSIQMLNRKFRRLMKEFARHGVDPRAILDEIQPAPAETLLLQSVQE
jgi:transposase